MLLRNKAALNYVRRWVGGDGDAQEKAESLREVKAQVEVRSAAVITTFFSDRFPRIALDRREGALEKCVVDDVAFAILAFDDPLALLDMAKAGICGDGAGVLALFGVD